MPKEQPRASPLIEWAIGILVREMQQGTHGQVSVHLHDGRILRVEVKKTEVPEARVLESSRPKTA